MSLLVLSWIAAQTAFVPIVLAQVQIEQRAVVRIRPVPARAVPAPRMRWDEKKGPKCVSMNLLAGALVSSPSSIDLYIKGGLRLRAKLRKSCPSIDFYSGFYVRPNKDGLICQDRDTIHSRTGGACQIDDFKSLVPAN